MLRRQVLIPLLLVGCGTQSPRTQPSPAPERPWAPMAARAFESHDYLFEDTPLGPDLGLSPGQVPDSLISTLLAHRFTLPPRVSVAILHLPGAQARRSWFATPEALDLTQTVADSTVAGISRAPRVSHAAVLPALLVGDQPTVASLREATARLQADVLLVYRPTCRLYERQPFIGSRQYRGVCTIEAVVLDTRFGIIPFSTVVTREAVTQHQHDDFDDTGTLRRVQLEALLAAAVDLSQRAGTFLVGAPGQ
ncbi:MAG TPA: hypothetical protein VKB45_06580 [Gemmatimonadales bacterium]|nr:hypothetical protein [Gemmatimonadales bacterium]